MSRRIALSIVVDAQPKFTYQAALWARSLMEKAGRSAGDFFIHCLPDVPGYFKAQMRALGAQVHDITPFEPAHPYCNKIQPWHSQSFENYDYVVFNDCDLVYLCWFDFDFKEAFYGRVVDRPNPPLNVLKRLFCEASLSLPGTVEVGFPGAPDEMTLFRNLNGGLYIVRRDLISAIGEAWRRYAHWYLDRRSLSRDYAKHIDQVSMAMALTSLDLSPTLLDPEYNFPTYLTPLLLQQTGLREPKILHFHDAITEHGRLKSVGIGTIDRAIEKVNRCIQDWNREASENNLFWDFRYSLFPELGSGVGSRGKIAERKKPLLRPFSALVHSAIDIGCGDLTVLADLPFQSYVGVDISEEALKCARAKRPDWQFATLDSTNFSNRQYELTLCLDVLIHQRTMEDYRKLAADAVRTARDLCLVSGYDAVPKLTSDIAFFHEPVFETLSRLPGVRRIERLARYRDVTLYAVIKEDGLWSRNDYQMPLVDFVRAYYESNDPDTFVNLYRRSLETICFFTPQYSRIYEYCWLLRKLRNDLRGQRILDVGAGVSAMPFVLADRGAHPVTVDNHTLNRSGTDPVNWNEWGFLDYGSIDPRIKSQCVDLLAFYDSDPCDAVYSISVIEHMPARRRRQVISRLAVLMKSQASLYLTVDLVPNTNKLWNRSEGKRVDFRFLHGTLNTLVRELQSFNFKILEVEVKRKIYKSRADIAFIEAVYQGDPGQRF